MSSVNDEETSKTYDGQGPSAGQEPSPDPGHYEYQKPCKDIEDGEYTQLEPEKESPKKRPKKKTHLSDMTKSAIVSGVAFICGVVVASGIYVMSDREYVADIVEAAGNVQVEEAGTLGNVQNMSQDLTIGETENSEVDGSSYFVGMGSVADVAENSMPFMVSITSEGVEELEEYFFGRVFQFSQEYASAGSGVIFGSNDDELLIVTNNHVVENSENLSVVFSADLEDADADDAVVEGKVKGTDSEHDIAVVAVELDDIPANVKGQIRIAAIGDSSKLRLGEQVVAIGNALGYGQSVTGGYVSALGREITIDGVTNSMIQTDAAINEGNSGGALLNMDGEVIGINCAKASSYGVEGMGYAIPSETFLPILDGLKDAKTRTKVGDDEETGFLGVTPVDVSDEAKEMFGVPSGAYVYEVSAGSAAESAGIKKGDILTAIDGISLTGSDDLFAQMKYYRPGESAVITVRAQLEGGAYDEPKEVTVIMGRRSEESDSSATVGGEAESESKDSWNPFGSVNPGYPRY